MKSDNNKLYTRAISHWGILSQIRMAQEEAIELALAISHWIREKNNVRNLVEEMADVSIMIEQLQLIMGVSDDELGRIKDSKLKRLGEKLDLEDQVKEALKR